MQLCEYQCSKGGQLTPKLMHKLFRDALYIHVSVDGYLWSRFNSVELSTVATLIASYGGILQVGFMVVFGKWD